MSIICTTRLMIKYHFSNYLYNYYLDEFLLIHINLSEIILYQTFTPNFVQFLVIPYSKFQDFYLSIVKIKRLSFILNRYSIFVWYTPDQLQRNKGPQFVSFIIVIFGGYWLHYQNSMLIFVIDLKLLALKGAGGSEVDFHFFVVSYRGEWQLPRIFFRMKNIVPSQSYWVFKSQKYIQLHCARELISWFPENQL